jgi:hypothetical protein
MTATLAIDVLVVYQGRVVSLALACADVMDREGWWNVEPVVDEAAGVAHVINRSGEGRVTLPLAPTRLSLFACINPVDRRR